MLLEIIVVTTYTYWLFLVQNHDCDYMFIIIISIVKTTFVVLVTYRLWLIMMFWWIGRLFQAVVNGCHCWRANGWFTNLHVANFAASHCTCEGILLISYLQMFSEHFFTHGKCLWYSHPNSEHNSDMKLGYDINLHDFV